STDGGQTWQPVLVGSRVTAVCTRASVLLAGTDTDGVVRSLDAGLTWSGANAGLLDLDILAVAASPNFDADRLGFVATASALYRSRNGGQSWREVDTGVEEPAVQCLAVGRDGLVVAGTEAEGLLFSRDAGATWQHPAQLAGHSVTAVAVLPVRRPP